MREVCDGVVALFSAVLELVRSDAEADSEVCGELESTRNSIKRNLCIRPRLDKTGYNSRQRV